MKTDTKSLSQPVERRYHNSYHERFQASHHRPLSKASSLTLGDDMDTRHHFSNSHNHHGRFMAAASASRELAHHQHHEDHSPPVSPLRLPQLSSSQTSISSWQSSSSQPASALPVLSSSSSSSSSSQRSSHSKSSSQSSLSFDFDADDHLCNSKEDRASYNTKFARYHLETYRQNDRMRWNFDFDHNAPLDDAHHHHNSHTVANKYHWKPL